MKLIIAGGRNLKTDSDFIQECLFMFNIGGKEIKEIVSGTAKGADQAGETWAERNSIGVHPIVTKFPADWDKHGKAAGHIRNRQMAEYGTHLLLIWDGKSRGSANMKKEMERLDKPVYEVILKEPEEDL